VSGSAPMRLAYRDDGLLILCWHVVSSLWSHGHNATYPPDHFVGLDYSSSAGIDPSDFKLSSIALRRLPYTHGGPRWRLTYGWEITRPRPHLERSGQLSASSGSGLSSELGGAASSPSPTSITSISAFRGSDASR